MEKKDKKHTIRKNHEYKKEQWTHECSYMTRHVRRGGRFIITNHFRDSLEKRKLTIGEVYSVFHNGTAEIIQGHAPMTYAVSKGALNDDELRVVFGKTKTGKIVHVVMAIRPDKKMKFVTVYYPELKYFLKDLKTLRPNYHGKNFLR